MPTIKKISLNGVPYDLGGGLTEDVKQASLQIAEKVAYIDEHGQDYYDELYTAFYDNMWNVTNTLSNAVNSNPAVKTPKDGTYTAIISAATGYTLEGATVSVTMNGANITSSVYNNGTISIPSVTGDVVITVVAVALTVVSISAVYTQSGTVYDTDSLDSLKADLVVTATFSDDSTEVVPSADYTLTGTLTAGTSTVTVSYGGQSATFNVTVTQLLPSGYTLLKWVEANGSQYVNTNIPETEEFLAEYAIYRTSSGANNGGHFLSSVNYYYPFVRMGGTAIMSKRAGTDGDMGFTWSINTIYHIVADFATTGNIHVNDSLIGTRQAGSTKNQANKLYLFAYGGTPGSGTYRYYGRFYYMRLYKNNELVHDYYPCKNENDVVGIYDSITGTFLSSGSGTALIAGEEA